MGRSALLLVTAIAVAFGFIGNSIRTASDFLIEAHSSYYKYSNARNLARLGVHRILRFIDGDGIQDVQNYNALQCSFNSGSYAVDTSSSGDTLNIHSVGRYNDTSYVMSVKLLYTPRPIPQAAGAVGVNTKISTFNPGNNKLKVDGRNYDSTGTNLVGSGDVPGFTVESAADSALVASQQSSFNSLAGNPKIAVNPQQEDPQDYLNDYVDAASYSYSASNQPPNNKTFGTAANPTIVTCNPGGDTTYGVTLTNVTGYGILVIYGGGTIKFSGNFSWKGLVIVYGVDTQLDFQTTGNADIVGGLVLAGNDQNNANIKINGNGNIKYSSSALSKARRIVQLSFYRVLDWYE